MKLLRRSWAPFGPGEDEPVVSGAGELLQVLSDIGQQERRDADPAETRCRLGRPGDKGPIDQLDHGGLSLPRPPAPRPGRGRRAECADRRDVALPAQRAWRRGPGQKAWPERRATNLTTMPQYGLALPFDTFSYSEADIR